MSEEAGSVFRVRYPFVKEPFEYWDEDGPTTIKTWRPGISVEMGDRGEADCWADSEGEMVLTVVSCHKPGRFPTRVFYTRKFIDPDGHEFGKGAPRICTLEKFRRISTAYRVPYVAEESFEEAAERRPVTQPNNTQGE